MGASLCLSSLPRLNRLIHLRPPQDEPKYRVASELSTEMLAAMKRGLDEGANLSTRLRRCSSQGFSFRAS
jgi:hypothetical protein